MYKRQVLDHLHAQVDVSGVVAGNEVSLVDVVGAADGLVAETQVADCLLYTSGQAAVTGLVCQQCLILLGIHSLGGQQEEPV